MLRSRAFTLLCSILLLIGSLPARAEVKELRLINSYGLSFLPFSVMQDQGLIEKHAKAAGIDLTVKWNTGGTGNLGNDALLSGAVDMVATGSTVMVALWDKTRGSFNVKGVSAFSAVPFNLITRNPNIKSVKDYTEASKIAMAGALISPQAVLLQMQAEKEFGAGNYNKLDSLTVTMTNPDGIVAMLSNSGAVDSHFTNPPFMYQELKVPGVRQLIASSDVLGGPSTLNLFFTTQKFHDENPKVYSVVLGALKEATDYCTSHKAEAAASYLKVMNDKKSSVDELVEILNKPEITFGLAPQRTKALADFMQKVGRLKNKPESWKDMYFSEIHDLDGS